MMLRGGLSMVGSNTQEPRGGERGEKERAREEEGRRRGGGEREGGRLVVMKKVKDSQEDWTPFTHDKSE